jgi:hypothetical protein
MHVRYFVIFFIHYKCLSIRRPYQTIGVTLHFLVLGITQRARPSMETIGEQAGGPTLTDAQRRKIERDKTRVRRGNVQQKRLHVFNNPSKLAFREWEEVPKPWTYADCDEYIEWCYIDKKFLPERHRKNRKSNKANLRFWSCPDFTQRCIEVY